MATPINPPDDPDDKSELRPQIIRRVRIEELLSGGRLIEIEHNGRIYRLQLNRANKLLLTA